MVKSPSRNGSVQLSSGNWFGVNILEVFPSVGKLSQLGDWLYAQRRGCASGTKALQAEGKQRNLKQALFSLGNLALIKDFYSRPVYTGRKARDIPSSAHRLINLWRQLHEGRVLNHSTVLVPYTDVLADHLVTITHGVPIKVIPNCYDYADYVDPPVHSSVAPNGKFIIGSVGRLWDYDLLKVVAEQYDCQSLLEIVPVVPHEEAVLEMRRSTCLLSPQVSWELPQRTPEYIATYKPILAFPDRPTAVSQEILRQYGGAVITSSKDEIKATLLDWYWEFKATGKISTRVNYQLVESFSAKRRAMELNEILEEAVAGCPRIVDRVPQSVDQTSMSVTLEKPSRPYSLGGSTPSVVPRGGSSDESG